MTGNTSGQTVDASNQNSGDEAVVEVGSEAYRSLSVREQAKVAESTDQSETREVYPAEANPEDYVRDEVQADVEIEDESEDRPSEEASIQDIREVHEEANEERTQRCGMDLDGSNRASGDVTPPEKILGRTLEETYLVMGDGLAMGALVRFETIMPGGTFEKTNASRGSALSKNDVSDVRIEARITKVTGRDTMGITTEGDLDVEDTSKAEGVKTVRGPGQILVEETLLDEIPDDAKWFIDP